MTTRLSRSFIRRSGLRALLAGIALTAGIAAHAERFSFAALGDTPYFLPQDYAAFERLIARVNQLKPAFTLHVGDIISGQTRCDDALYAKVRAMFATFDGALVYTPGDNEWTDCHRANSGRYDPIERLARVREMFFADPAHSLGRAPLTVIPQSADPRYAKFVENARWERSGVVFATVHIPGSNNNLARDQAAVNEYIERNTANLAWIDAVFARAKDASAKGIVFAFQADLRFEFEPPLTDQRTGYNDVLDAFKRNALAWRKPVLLIHGDKHHLVIDQPLIGPGRKRILNVTRLMVHGEDEVHATLIGIDTDNPDLFSFTPVYVQENIPAPKPAVKP